MVEYGGNGHVNDPSTDKNIVLKSRWKGSGINFIRFRNANTGYLATVNLNFDGITIYSTDVLPDFTAIYGSTYSFKNGGSISADPFIKAYKANKLHGYGDMSSKVDLRGNAIESKVSVPKGLTLDLRSQKIYKDLGKVEQNSTFTKKLPSIFESNMNVKTTALGSLTWDSNKNRIIKFDTSKTGKKTVTVTVSDSRSSYNGSSITYTYNVIKKSTNTTPNKPKPVTPNNNNKPNNNTPNNNTPNNNTPSTPTQIGYLKATVSSTAGYARSKKIKVQLTASNLSVNQATIYVDGKKVTNNNGVGEYEVTKDGTYKVVVKHPYLVSDISLTFVVNGIDRTKPGFTYDLISTKGVTQRTLRIMATDDYEIRKIAVNGTNIYNMTGFRIKTVDYLVTKKGKYKVTVTDTAGNTYEKTVDVHIDTTSPQIQNITVEKNNNIGNIGNVKNSKYCQAKIGDIITVKMTAHENIDSYGQILLNGKAVTVQDAKLEGKTLSFKIELTKALVDTNQLDGYVNIEVKDLKDKFGNTGSYSNKELLYLDKVLPKIEKIEITGGKPSKDNSAIEIYQDYKIKIEMNMSEKLANEPTVTIGGLELSAKYVKDIKVGNDVQPQYSLTVETNELIKYFKTKGIENSFIPVTISRYMDNAGNIGDTVTIDENNKSSNGVCLVYGKALAGELYFSGIGAFETATEEAKANIRAALGDINADGFINEYDYLLLTRYLSDLEKLHKEQEKFANTDGKDSIDKKDLVALNKIIEERKNELFKDEVVTLKVYNQENKEIPMDKLEISIVEGEKLVTFNKNSEKTTITANGTKGEVLIRAVYNDDTGYTQQIGEMRFIIGTINEGTAGFEVIDGTKDFKVMGDVNFDGFATVVDSILIGHEVADLMEFNKEQMEVADVIQDAKVNVKDRTAVEKINYFNYRGMKKGDKIKLKFISFALKSYEEFKDESIIDQIKWYTKTHSDSVAIRPNADGPAEMEVNGSARVGEKLTVVCEARTSSSKVEKAEFNIQIIDKVKIELTNKEIHYDFSKLPEKNEVLKATANIINRKIEWKSLDESIAKIEVDKFGNATVIPVKPGKTEITATVDGVVATCKVDIIESITGLNIDKETINIKETMEEEVKITVTPSTATEEPIMISKDEKIAKAYKDKDTGAYRIAAKAEGTTTVTVSSPSNTNISKEIVVNVKKLVAPELKTIHIDQDEEEKVYTIGAKLNIKFIFTDKIKGEAPNLNLKFGDYKSVGTPEFVGFEDDNTAIAYSYIIQEGDNGILEIESLEDGSLTDDTGTVKAILTIDPQLQSGLEDIESTEVPEGTEGTEGTEETEGTEDENNEGTEEVASYKKTLVIAKAMTSETEQEEGAEEESDEELAERGINKFLSAVAADTVRPTLIIVSDIDKDSNWLKKGDIAKIKITASEELSTIPTVTMGGVAAKVEGSGKEFTASLEIVEQIVEGELEIKVTGYKDLAGNEGLELIAKEENIDESIIIDNSETKISAIKLLLEEGKEYKAGEQFKIEIDFEDKTISRPEFITAEEAPKLNIKFGDKDAQGKLECDLISGEHSSTITYTYTISENDDGKISLNGISGTISDVAGNTTDLSELEELPEMESVTINKDETNDSGSNNDGNNNNSNNNNSNNNNSNNNNSSNNDSNKKEDPEDDGKKENGKLPFTGSTVAKTMLIATGVLAIIGLYVMKKKHLRLRIRIK